MGSYASPTIEAAGQNAYHAEPNLFFAVAVVPMAIVGVAVIAAVLNDVLIINLAVFVAAVTIEWTYHLTP